MRGTSNAIIQERRELFAKRYKECFGIEVDFEMLEKQRQEKIENGEYTLVLNYYGIKSHWL